MRLRARFAQPGGDRTREVEVGEDGFPRQLSLDGVAALFDVATLPGGRFTLIAASGAQAELSVARDPDGAVRVSIGRSVFRFELLDELTARALSAAGGSRAKRAGDLKAPIPGRVLRILAAPGDHVEAGKTVLVLEAMKMENEVRAVRAGVISSIDVAAGQAVGTGDVLVRFVED